MAELDYFNACAAVWDVRDSVGGIKNGFVRAAVEAFADNLLRTRSLLLVPGYVFFAAEKWQASFWRAWQSVGKGTSPEDATIEQQRELKEKALRLMAEAMIAQRRDDPHCEKALTHGLANFEGLIEYAGGFVRDGTQASLSMAILSTWTALEVLATDLWVTAVNQLPKSLGANAFGARSDESLSRIAATESERKTDRIDLDLLFKYDLDLKTRFGDFLYREGPRKFNTLDSLQNAYSETFCHIDGKTGRRNRPTWVIQWADPAHQPGLRLTEALRHVLAHKGGRADEKFRERIEVIKHPLASAPIGEAIPVSGPLVVECVDGTRTAAKLLVEGVDGWLSQSAK
jgi:hypothetical protein